jgi:hypothetical protein
MSDTCSFKDRLRVYSDERVQRSVYGEVQGELFDLVRDLFTHAGAKDSFPKSLTAGRSVWDSLKCPSKSKIKGIKKPELDDFTERVCRFLVERCYPLLDRLSGEVEDSERRLLDSQEELIASQRALVEAQGQLVKLQCQLLEKRDKEITAVQSTAEEEIKTFSSVLKKGCDTALAPKRIRTAITSAAEDRTNNLIVHGLFDDKDETSKDLENIVGRMFDYMGEGVTGVHSMTRLGRFREGSDRPLKLRLCGREFRDQILARKSALKKSEDHKDVYLSPDRSPEEREERRRVVAELKEKKKAEPGGNFGIRGGKVVDLEE